MSAGVPVVIFPALWWRLLLKKVPVVITIPDFVLCVNAIAQPQHRGQGVGWILVATTTLKLPSASERLVSGLVGGRYWCPCV